jgi:hypothetical protein
MQLFLAVLLAHCMEGNFTEYTILNKMAVPENHFLIFSSQFNWNNLCFSPLLVAIKVLGFTCYHGNHFSIMSENGKYLKNKVPKRTTSKDV